MLGPDTIYYDGYCGLCHRWVKFVMPRDDGTRFRFAPLQGPTFTQAVDAETRERLPDSIIVQRHPSPATAPGDGGEPELLTKSTAILHILRRLGGGWRVLSWLGRAVPRPLRDVVYDGVAAVRHRVFARPNDACPMMPPELRSRFLP